MNRDAFMSRVRSAAAAGRAYRVGAGPKLEEVVGYCGAGDDPLARLALEIEAAGGRARLVGTVDEASQALGEMLDRHRPKAALCWRHPVFERLRLDELLVARGIERLDYDVLAPLEPDTRRQRMLSAELGISSVDYAVAETGTLALASGAGQERLASLAPPVHIAVVEARQVLADLFDLFARLADGVPDGLATNWTLITGPSKTGDLELRLTTGVHGPGEWHVVIIRS